MSEQEKNQTPRRPYSYHTFIFPFLFQDGSKNVSRKDFTKCLHKGFEKDIFTSQSGTDNTVEYARFRYFNRAARNAIYTSQWDDKAVVWNYRLNLDALLPEGAEKIGWKDVKKDWNNPVRLVFKKGSFKADLTVNDIRLKLFDTGVGMLVFEVENYEPGYEGSIKKINEYGRRVFMPFVTPSGECSLCADEVYLLCGKKEIVNGCVSGANVEKTDEIMLSPIIQYLLTRDQMSVTTAENPSKNFFRIEPIIDDRMFVACVYNAPEFAAAVCEWDSEQNQYRYISDATAKPLDKYNVARRFYEMVFVDADGLTCQNRTMLAEMNQEHSFARWIEYGTLTGISEYSLVCMTGDSTDVFNINPFLTEYVEMLILVLAQRASLLAFERAISEVTCKKKFKMDVEKIHRRYVAFESELLLSEVTSQQQGIELYDMMLKNLFIDRLTDDLDNQINSLYELHTADHEEIESLLLNTLAVIGTADILSVLLHEAWELHRFWGFLIGGALGCGVMFLIDKIRGPIKRKF